MELYHDIAPFMPAHSPPAGTGTPDHDDKPAYHPSTLLSPRSTPVTTPLSHRPMIHNVYVYNIPPRTQWPDFKALLLDYIPDSALLHIQIFQESACAVVSLNAPEMAQKLNDQLHSIVWKGYLLSTAQEFEDENDPLQPLPDLVPQIVPGTPMPVSMPMPMHMSMPMPMPMPRMMGPPMPGPIYGTIPQHMPDYTRDGYAPAVPSPMMYAYRPPSRVPMGYYAPPPPPQQQQMYTQKSQQFHHYGPQTTYHSPRTPNPQLSHQGPQQRTQNSSRHNSTSSTSTPMFTYHTNYYSTNSPTISTRQLGNLRQYPYHSITDIESTSSSSRNNSNAVSDRRRLFIGNVPFFATWKDLKDMLRRAGSIIRVEVPMEGTQSRGFAIASFEDEEDASLAIQMFDGAEFMGRNLTVRYDKFPKRVSDVSSVKFGEEREDESVYEEKEKEIEKSDDDAAIEKRLHDGVSKLLEQAERERDVIDDKKFADEARSLVESLRIGD